MGTNPKATTRVFWIIYRYVVQIDYVKVKKMPKATQTNPNCHGWDREENSRPWIYARTWPICTQEAACVTTWSSFPDCWSDKQVSTGKLALWLTADIHAMALRCVLFCDMQKPSSCPFAPYAPANFAPFCRRLWIEGNAGKDREEAGTCCRWKPNSQGMGKFLGMLPLKTVGRRGLGIQREE